MNRLSKHTDVQSGGRIDVLIIEEAAGDKAYWVAQCLQYDIAVQADSLPELKDAFHSVLAGNVLLALERGLNPLADFKPAPEKYWKQYREARESILGLPIEVPQDRIPKTIDLSRPAYRHEALMKFAATV